MIVRGAPTQAAEDRLRELEQKLMHLRAAHWQNIGGRRRETSVNPGQDSAKRSSHAARRCRADNTHRVTRLRPARWVAPACCSSIRWDSVHIENFGGSRISGPPQRLPP
jgi:hypothetical protein